MKSKRSKIISVLAVLAIGGLGIGASPYLYTEYLGWQFKREVQKQPLFALIIKNYPEDFSAYLSKVKKNLKKPEGNLIQMESAQLVNKIFYQSLQQAPDEYIVLYLKATLDLYHYLNGQDPRAVVKLENGDENIEYDLISLYITKDFQTRLVHLLETKRFVIEASIQAPAKFSEKQAASLLQGILTDLGNKFSEPVVQQAFTGNQVSAKVASKVIIEFYTHILGMGKEDAGSVMRYIASFKKGEKEIENKKLKVSANLGVPLTQQRVDFLPLSHD